MQLAANTPRRAHGLTHLYHSVITLLVSLPFWSMCQLRARPKSAILRQPSLELVRRRSRAEQSTAKTNSNRSPVS